MPRRRQAHGRRLALERRKRRRHGRPRIPSARSAARRRHPLMAVPGGGAVRRDDKHLRTAGPVPEVRMSSRGDRSPWARAVALALAFLALLVAAPRAGAQDRVYWTESGAGTGFGFAALDGSGGGALGLAKPKTKATEDFTVDTADGQLLWGERFEIESIGF